MTENTLTDALAANIRRAIEGEEQITDARFETLVAAWRASKTSTHDHWIGELVVVTPTHSGWQTLGRLVAIGDRYVELADAAPARYPDVDWGRVLIPLADVASIRIPIDPNQGA